MLRKSFVLAVAATAALGLASVSATSAFAGGGGGGHHGGGHWGGHPHWHVGYHHHPIWVPRPVVYTAVRPVVATPGPCTCLSKEYTPEGAVVFKDRCTNEMAMNPPPAPPAQTGSLEPQQQFSQQYIQPTPANAQPQTTAK